MACNNKRIMKINQINRPSPGLRTRVFGLSLVLAALVSASINVSGATLGGSASHNIRDYVPIGLHDLTVRLKTGQYNQAAGARISKEFGMLYKLSGNGTMRYKEPNSIRFDGKIGGMRGALIMSGWTQRIHVGSVHHDQDETGAPGRVTTLLDIGLLSDFYLSYTDAHFQGMQSVEGTPCAVFRFSYPARLKDTSFRLVWIDPRTRIIRKREEHGQDGVLHATFTVRSSACISGIWLPTEVDAANAQGDFVGQTYIQEAQVNSGLADSLFH